MGQLLRAVRLKGLVIATTLTMGNWPYFVSTTAKLYPKQYVKKSKTVVARGVGEKKTSKCVKQLEGVWERS